MRFSMLKHKSQKSIHSSIHHLLHSASTCVVATPTVSHLPRLFLVSFPKKKFPWEESARVRQPRGDLRWPPCLPHMSSYSRTPLKMVSGSTECASLPMTKSMHTVSWACSGRMTLNTAREPGGVLASATGLFSKPSGW